MANQAIINATPEQKAVRNVGRIKTLRAAIEKATDRKQAKRVKSLQKELDRRMSEVKAMKEALAEVDA